MPVAKHRLDFSELITHGAKLKAQQAEKNRNQYLDAVDYLEMKASGETAPDSDIDRKVEKRNSFIGRADGLISRHVLMSARILRALGAWYVTALRLAVTVFAFLVLAVSIAEGLSDTLILTIDIIAICVNVYFILEGSLKMLGYYAFVTMQYDFKQPLNVMLLVRQSGVLEVVIACCSLGYGQTLTGAWFHLARICLLSLSLMEQWTHIDVLMSGIVLGLHSLLSTWLLLTVVFFIYAACAMTLFRKNDPFHFGSIAMSMWTFFELSTFDGWEKVLYVNMYGCDYFPYFYVPGEDVDASEPRSVDRIGEMFLPICDSPEPRPLVSALTFISFVLICGFILMSLTVAAVVGGIKDRLDEINTAKDDEDESSVLPSARSGTVESTFDPELAMMMLKNTWAEEDEACEKRRRRMEKRRTTAGRMGSTAASADLDQLRANYAKKQTLRSQVSNVFAHIVDPNRRSIALKFISGHSYYRVFFAVAIILGAFMEIWILREERTTLSVLVVLYILQSFYSIDVVLRWLAHYPRYSSFLNDNWNVFDAAVVLSSWLSFFSGRFEGGKYIGLLRVLRILRVLRLLTWINRLNVMMKAVASSLKALLYVFMLMCVLFFHFAVAGVLLFRRNDNHHFGTIFKAFVTLFQLCSLENWSFVARTQMYGCDYFGYQSGNDEYDMQCEDPRGLGWLAAWYFIIFIVLGVLVLVNLFVGIIITSMELLKDGSREESAVWAKVRIKQREHQISDSSIDNMLEIFEMIDQSNSASLTLSELQPLMRCIVTDEVQQITLFMKADHNNNGQLNFSEFIDLIHLLGDVFRNPLKLKPAIKPTMKILASGVNNLRLKKSQLAVLGALNLRRSSSAKIHTMNIASENVSTEKSDRAVQFADDSNSYPQEEAGSDPPPLTLHPPKVEFNMPTHAEEQEPDDPSESCVNDSSVPNVVSVDHNDALTSGLLAQQPVHTSNNAPTPNSDVTVDNGDGITDPETDPNMQALLTIRRLKRQKQSAQQDTDTQNPLPGKTSKSSVKLTPLKKNTLHLARIAKSQGRIVH
mmetsp:Transcript_14746/g.22232  ORF Transcript_14746/g.22232 Transcript_14746/m.22232 type:complete len:1039 (-) Transcript_14746:356-3472(-)|eukprot:CAMPEP_0185041258 /NCGR_PEP_ID=MMETSP1103-20130426/40294_1 /TAXON_ID=36769 /ORGANISM="Paraphysomonas bandaiensis, Strain Caron Lab Isolate" /LENGTH=1038 /DNA_ID=CAMNT_0027580901 /DNA_START=130 /DNA_END=3246 /DNA_ORIENTATION=-